MHKPWPLHYSNLFQVSDHASMMGPGQQQQFFPPRGGQPLPGMTALPQSHNMVNNIPGNTDTVIYKPDGRGPPSHISGLQQQQQQLRGPPPPLDDMDDAFPPPPPVRPMNGNASADVSLNDSASTTQSNVTSECSEAECDREPLVKHNRGNGLL